MQEVIPFKTRVKDVINNCAGLFKRTFLEYEYIVCSHAFDNHVVLVKGTEGNYLHLTGVHTSLTPESFYKKAIDGKITEADFDFKKRGVSENSVKGSVREKIKVLPFIEDFFNHDLLAAQGFLDNKVADTFSSADKLRKITIGFVPNGNPMSLLKGMKLRGNIQSVDLVLKKAKQDSHGKFVIIYGNDDCLQEYLPYIEKLIDAKNIQLLEKEERED